MRNMVTEKEIIEELRRLDPSRWSEVRDFIAFLKQRAVQEPVQDHPRPLTGWELFELGSMGLWADRHDIRDSLSFARELRQHAGYRDEGSLND